MNRIRPIYQRLLVIAAVACLLSGCGGSTEKTEKYEELLEKERDLISFMEGFDRRKTEVMGEKKAKEDCIVALLDKITKLENVCSYAQSRKEGEVSVLAGHTICFFF